MRQRRRALAEPAAVRTQQILDAALAEFCMEDIAQTAERSKSGLYAHFPSQQALCGPFWNRCESAPGGPGQVQTQEQRVDAFVCRTPQCLAEPAPQPVLRPSTRPCWCACCALDRTAPGHRMQHAINVSLKTDQLVARLT